MHSRTGEEAVCKAPTVAGDRPFAGICSGGVEVRVKACAESVTRRLALSGSTDESRRVVVRVSF
jgi:hypothetical protein